MKQMNYNEGASYCGRFPDANRLRDCVTPRSCCTPRPSAVGNIHRQFINRDLVVQPAKRNFEKHIASLKWAELSELSLLTYPSLFQNFPLFVFHDDDFETALLSRNWLSRGDRLTLNIGINGFWWSRSWLHQESFPSKMR